MKLFVYRNVISCLLLNSVSLGDVHIPLSLYCLSAVHDKVIFIIACIKCDL